MATKKLTEKNEAINESIIIKTREMKESTIKRKELALFAKELTTAKKTAVDNWKQEKSIFGIINYMVNNYHKDASLRNALSFIQDLNGKSSKEQLRAVLTVDYLLSCLTEKQRIMPNGENRKFYSLGVVLGAMQARFKEFAHEQIKALTVAN